MSGLDVFPVTSLAEAVRALNEPSTPPLTAITPRPAQSPSVADLADVRGQLLARRALEIASAGGHNLLLVGPPGAGKTMMARRVPGILPPLTFDEALEATAVHSVAGLLPPGTGLLVDRPFRAPHHTISNVALVGGGSQPRPGEVSLAHHGVLFLDEMLEFNRHVLEVLRQPLEEGRVTIARAARTAIFPARFMLVAAMNPCPCGFLGDTDRECRCTPQQVARYRGRLSGPLRDRLDLTVEVPALPPSALATGTGESSIERSGARDVGARGTARPASRQRNPDECGAHAGADGAVLPARFEGHATAGRGGRPHVAQRARLRSGSQGGADNRGSRGHSRHRRRSRRRSAPVPDDLTGLNYPITQLPNYPITQLPGSRG